MTTDIYGEEIDLYHTKIDIFIYLYLKISYVFIYLFYISNTLNQLKF